MNRNQIKKGRQEQKEYLDMVIDSINELEPIVRFAIVLMTVWFIGFVACRVLDFINSEWVTVVWHNFIITLVS